MSAPVTTNILALEESSTEPTSASEGNIYVDDGTNDQVGLTKIRWYDGSQWTDSMRKEVAIIKDEKTSSVAGGSYTTPNNTVRDLNTLSVNQDWISISSNQFTIDGANYPGYYTIEFYGMRHQGIRFYHYLQDVTTSNVTVALSNSGYTGGANRGTTWTKGITSNLITASQTFEVITSGNTTRATDGLGQAHNLHSNVNCVYTMVVIERHF